MKRGAEYEYQLFTGGRLPPPIRERTSFTRRKCAARALNERVSKGPKALWRVSSGRSLLGWRAATPDSRKEAHMRPEALSPRPARLLSAGREGRASSGHVPSGAWDSGEPPRGGSPKNMTLGFWAERARSANRAPRPLLVSVCFIAAQRV